MIPGYEKFTYSGYTQANPQTLPTLYFKQGRYTQQHTDHANIGWHPYDAPVYRLTNITPAAVADIMKIPPGDPRENDFARDVIAGKYDDQSETGTCCECFSYDGKSYSVHISRSRFIAVGTDGFKIEYSREYAMSVLRDGTVAPNEYRDF